MVSTSTLGLISLVIRLFATILFLMVLKKQLSLRFSKFDDDLNTLRTLLIGLTSIPVLFNLLAIVNNYIRWTNGKQSEILNNFSFVLGAVASACTALILFLIYRTRQP
jgi:hypothetical protein